MKIEVKKFGDLLISRPAGHEACLAARAYLKPKSKDEPIELDFSGVKVLAPSWADEFISGLKKEYGNRVVCLPSSNLSVVESLKILDI
ncbi:MAG: STAS-like domain-containing protein [Deltaproteobacteria bacterium]|nr:STAS-like domain-containing protein [Deltaproteobacteria bacterium]